MVGSKVDNSLSISLLIWYVFYVSQYRCIAVYDDHEWSFGVEYQKWWSILGGHFSGIYQIAIVTP